tara:strand:- start:224 stop:1348 length:1125 start_codon:yes stop_codon:yes gene_type:complete
MKKSYYSLGLMSGTSMDGVDASIIRSDGKSKYKAILDNYFEYPKNIYKNLTKLRDKISNSRDLKKYRKQIKFVEKEITIFHAKVVIQILKKTKLSVDFIGFHGQTIFHNAEEQITKQLGDGKLLSKLTKKTVVYDFRQNDLKNRGQGAPLTPVFHKLLAKKLNLKTVTFLNIGGITNETSILEGDYVTATDLGPGMCLIDEWIRNNSKKKYDDKGKIAMKGKINNSILEKAYIHTHKLAYMNKINKNLNKTTFDIKDFNLYYFDQLSLKDGAATITELTFKTFLRSFWVSNPKIRTILCGGGRKNDFLVKKLKNYKKLYVKLIDDYGIDGDFVESQAFAYLAIRSFLKLPITFPKTTGCNKPCTGGILVRNFKK